MSQKGNSSSSEALINGASENTGAQSKPVTMRQTSKKFQIETVDVSEDPLYNKEGSRPTTPNSPQPPTSSDSRPTSPSTPPPSSSAPTNSSSPPSAGSALAAPNLPTSSSEERPAIHQTSTKPDKTGLANGGDTSAANWSPPSRQTSSDEVTIRSGKVRNGNVPGSPRVRYSRRPGDGKLKFDDSFYKKATVQQMIDDEEQVAEDGVTDIYVPVPTIVDPEPSAHETITSAYETNISINKLLRERHKGSLAAMGRLFGSKQREMEAQKKAAALMPMVETKEKKRPCHRVKPIHVCLIILCAMIIIAAVTTLVLFEAARKLEAANRGYEFKYSSRELFIYPWKRPNHDILEEGRPVFRAKLGSHVGKGAPFNCSTSLLQTENETDIGCFRWQGAVTLNLTHTNLDSHSVCINVHWETTLFDPKLEDCFSIDAAYGMWYGGFNGLSSWPLGSRDVEPAPYFPGEVFGDVVERFWLSSKGVAVIASPGFPLHLQVNDTEVCIASWYGYSDGTRTMSYSVCRSDNHTTMHANVMKHFYPTLTTRTMNLTEFSQPIFYKTNKYSNISLALANEVNYSFIFDTSDNSRTAGNSDMMSRVADNRQGVVISPIVPLQTLMTPEYLGSDLWIKSTNLDSPRLFNVRGTLSTVINTSSSSIIPHIQENIPNKTPLVKISETGIAHITEQHQYQLDEINSTFRHYTHRLMESISNHTSAHLMTAVLSGMDRCSVIVSLPPVTNLADTVRNVIQTSLMGYNILSPGLISGNLSSVEFIRATQVAIFSAVMEFSDTIYDAYSDAIRDIWRRWLQVRQELGVVRKIQEKLETDPSSPLFTPVWWYDTNSKLFQIADEFVFNNKYLIAPIVDTNATSRIVYFPPGLWFQQFFYCKELSNISYYRGNTSETLEIKCEGELLVFQYLPEQ